MVLHSLYDRKYSAYFVTFREYIKIKQTSIILKQQTILSVQVFLILGVGMCRLYELFVIECLIQRNIYYFTFINVH